MTNNGEKDKNNYNSLQEIFHCWKAFLCQTPILKFCYLSFSKGTAISHLIFYPYKTTSFADYIHMALKWSHWKVLKNKTAYTQVIFYLVTFDTRSTAVQFWTRKHQRIIKISSAIVRKKEITSTRQNTFNLDNIFFSLLLSWNTTSILLHRR